MVKSVIVVKYSASSLSDPDLHHTKFAAMNGVLIWWMKKNGGASFPSQANSKLSSTERGWLFMQAFNSGFGTLSSLTVNQADIARYARLPQDQVSR